MLRGGLRPLGALLRRAPRRAAGAVSALSSSSGGGGTGSGVRVVTMNAEFADMPDAVWLKRALPNADIASRSNNRQVQAELCASGGGLAVLPRPLGDRDRRLVEIDIGATPPGRDTYVGYHRDMRRLARLRVLLDLVIERLVDRRS